MARLTITDDELVVRLSSVEVLATGRRTLGAGLACVEAVSVLPTTSFAALDALVDVGLAATGAPLRGLGTALVNARSRAGGRAAVFTRRGRPAVSVRLHRGAHWQLVVISLRTLAEAEETRQSIESARSGTGDDHRTVGCCARSSSLRSRTVRGWRG